MNYFEILNCDINSTTEEIKENYRKLILQFHPDKNPNDNASFHTINEAWNVLKDERERKVYESQLLSQKSLSNHIYKQVSREEMKQDGVMFSYPCRCGAEFCVVEEDLRAEDTSDENIYIACDTCSLLLDIVLTR